MEINLLQKASDFNMQLKLNFTKIILHIHKVNITIIIQGFPTFLYKKQLKSA